MSDYNILFMTHLASVVGTGLTCIGFPLMSPVVLSCTFNLLAAVSSLLLSILVGWDTLMADDLSTQSSSSLLLTQGSFYSSNHTNQLQNNLPFMEEVTLVSTLFGRATLPDQTLKVEGSEWFSFETNFDRGLEYLQSSIVSPIYYNEKSQRCLTINMGNMNEKGSMAGWKQEICLSKIGREVILSAWGQEKQQENRVLQWLNTNRLPISRLPVFRGKHWVRFYREWSIPIMKALLTQTKDVLKGEKNSSWSIEDGSSTLFTSNLWKEPH